jgi:DNA-binding beta-propeller fold protein YncE
VRSSFVLALATVLLLLCGSVPASALVHRGHVFSSAFGEAGAGPGQMAGPSQVAVDESSGDLYVVDAGNERVDVFAPDGHGGYTFASDFKIHTPGAIAVDNSNAAGDPSKGDVYVVGTPEKEETAEERSVVYEYSPATGEVIHKWSVFKAKVEGEQEELELEEISGVSVDAAGVLWVDWEEEGVIDGLAKEASKGGAPKLAWQPGLRREPEIEFKFECPAHEGFAVAPHDEDFYTAYERENLAEECPGEFGETPDPTVVAKLDGAQPQPHTLTSELVGQNTTGVAVDPVNGDVYLDNGGSVLALTAEGQAIQRFGGGDISGAEGMAVDAATGQAFVVEPASDEVVIFGPEEAPAAPVVDSIAAKDLSPGSTELSAEIDPRGLATTYQFEYGTSDCLASPGSCTKLPAAKLAAGFGDEEVHAVVSGLAPATAYFYRVVATSTAGTGEDVASPNTFTTLPSPAVMPDGRAWELVTPPEKHGAAVETIGRFRGGSIQAAADGGAIAWLATGPVISEPEGSRSFELTQLMSRRESSSWQTTSMETPHEQGRGILVPSPSEYHFFSPDLSRSLLQPTEPFGALETPPLAPEATEKTMYVRASPPAAPGYLPLVTAADDTAGSKFGRQLEFLDATEDLKHVLFESRVGLTSAHPASAGIYEWEEGAPLRLVTLLPDNTPAPDEPNAPSVVGDNGALNERGAISSDGTKIFWSSGDEKHLYLRDMARDETIAINAAQGHDAVEPGLGGAEVPEPSEEGQEVHFQSASSDGSRVYFTDTARLTEDSSLEPTGEEPPADLYVFELTSGAGQPLRGRLTDLTADPAAGRADVLNLIPGASTDGSRVYFVANGVLAAGAKPGQCLRNPEGETPAPPPGSTCNLYVGEADPAHPGTFETSFVAALSEEDAADWGAGETTNLLPRHGNLSDVTSRVSPSGSFITFMSERSLTGYDARDAQSGEADEEVYVYDAESRRLVCASCNQAEGTGGQAFQRPQGVFDSESANDGVGLLVDRPELWRHHWLAASLPGWDFNFTGARSLSLYQPRYLSDDGRLFFDSSDALVPQDTNGKEDVYEYEPDGVGSCEESGGCIGLISAGTGTTESIFLDASENGNDVFFSTASQLVATDVDNTFDIYDAHVCEPSSPCITVNVQSEEECASANACLAPPAPPAANGEAPASATFAGPPSVSSSHSVLSNKSSKPPTKPLTRKQKLAKALKQCHKLKGKHKRQLCEKQARKKYGPKKKPAPKKGAR